MDILDKSVYVGPSHYAHFPVIRLVLDLGELEQWPTSRLGREFIDALLVALPGLNEHGCSYGEPGGFVRRMSEDEGTWLGHVLEHVAIELQNVAGVKVTFGKTRGTSRPGVYDVVFEYEQQEVGIEAAHVALDLLHSLLPRDHSSFIFRFYHLRLDEICLRLIAVARQKPFQISQHSLAIHQRQP